MVRPTQLENGLASGQPWFAQVLLVAPRITVETTDATASLRPSLTHPLPSRTSKLAFQPGFEWLIRIMSRLKFTTGLWFTDCGIHRTALPLLRRLSARSVTQSCVFTAEFPNLHHFRPMSVALLMRVPQHDPTGGSIVSGLERRMRAPRACVERHHERYDTTKNFAEVCGLWSKLLGRATHSYSRTLLQ